MNTDPQPPLSFDTLRAKGIEAAQDASGHHWTDYNLHDPGVTLLEQTAFSLTEVAYQSDHDVRDLLTNKQGNTTFDHLGLFAPEEVLIGRPVTHADLASRLSDAAGIDRVFVRSGTKVGLVNLMIIPADGHAMQREANALIKAVSDIFEDNRLLCTDVNQIKIAERRPVRLQGSIQIAPLADPERIVAEIIYRTRHLLRGVHPFHTDEWRGANRSDAFEDPSALWSDILSETNSQMQLNVVMAAIKVIPGVEDISGFDIIDLDWGTSITDGTRPMDAYHDPEPPDPKSLEQLIVMQSDAQITLRSAVITEELGRLQAAEVAAKSNRKDHVDWDVLTDGHHRDMTRDHIDAMLPRLYIQKTPASAPESRTRRHQQGQLDRYRHIANAHVTRVAAPLDGLSDTFCVSQPIDFNDPAQIRDRIEMLDYLISLQGEEMPKVTASTIHGYRGARARARWRVEWREKYLAQLPSFNALKGTAHPENGFAARLAHLADLRSVLAEPREGLDTTLVYPSNHVTPPAPTAALQSDAEHFLIKQKMNVRILDQEAITALCPWVIDGRTTPALFQRAASAEAYTIVRADDDLLELRFNHDDSDQYYPCISSVSHDVLETWANRLRLTFQQLNEDAERLLVVEDIKLRGHADDFAPATAHAFIAGWTLRTTRPAYRRYVAGLIERFAPAHIVVHLHWLDPAQMHDLKVTHQVWQDGQTDQAAKALRQFIAGCEASS